MQTPYFPAFRSHLAALGRRSRHALRQTTLAQLQQHLRELLPPGLLSCEPDGPNSRQRVFSLRLTFECFVWQMLKPRTPCREVVRQIQALMRLQDRAPVDESDSAYIQARQRLPRERLEKALSATAQAADHRAGSGGQLQGRPVKVVDGSTTQLPDTRPNQKRYPQPSSQKPGCGFPVIRFVALLSLNSGAILKVMMGMETLRCLSPEMAEKELLAYLVAHNLIRCVMAEAVARHRVQLERISFKGSLDALRQYSAAISQAPNRKLRRQLWEDLLLNLARDLVPFRPNRRQPRAVKHRPKAYPLLNQPRRRFVEISHRSRYWKGRPRNYRGLN